MKYVGALEVYEGSIGSTLQLKKSISYKKKTVCEVYSCRWVAWSHSLFHVEYGGVVFEVGEGKKDSDYRLW